MLCSNDALCINSLFLIQGGVLKKIFFSSCGVVGAASLCYPNQAVEITQDAYNKAVDHVKTTWNGPGM